MKLAWWGRSSKRRCVLAGALATVATGVVGIQSHVQAALPRSVVPVVVTGDQRVGGTLTCNAPRGEGPRGSTGYADAVDVRWDTGSGYPSAAQAATLDTTGLSVGQSVRCNSGESRDSAPVVLVSANQPNGVPVFRPFYGSVWSVDNPPDADGYYTMTVHCEATAWLPDGSAANVSYRWLKGVYNEATRSYDSFLVGSGPTIEVGSEDALGFSFPPDLSCQALATGPRWRRIAC